MNPTEWLTLILVIVTTFYAWATYRILAANRASVEVMRQQTEAMLRPYVVVAPSVRIGTTLMQLEVQNTGRSPAFDLRLTLDKDFYPQAEESWKSLRTIPAFSQPIVSLAPGARLVFMLGVGFKIFLADEALCPKVFSVKAEYKFGEQAYSENNVIDMNPMVHAMAVNDPVASELEKLRKELKETLKLFLGKS